ncbi:gamma carbonic anhydrase family protein [Oceanospirillaceae bacterium]|jgi:carbonic anhydrase/acetyltransferase-like protein (isoleucine patch superfamily)|uniref:gamma carbonic anhydrase family protein n=1 Tax=Candidatus Njordibacter sp. Uisw_002 TaxID=3230971 RepID=UPI0023731AE6|nr:gamma carbonic anhydrase family protein [Oceanospirillaceae bacterium]MDC1341529.1 gamma carbonic anhydrase family protein [Oceanospirillaceae bacterium]|tara:strand:- start:2717 stop:3256 length:540 start_codon:yes stop_codon:yes gene_type:complete
MSIRPLKHATPKIDPTAFADQQCIIIGDVHIGADSSIWPYSVVRGDVNHIRIGHSTSIQDGSILHVTHKSAHNPQGYPLIIGDQVTVGHRAILHGCTIGDRVLVGMGSTVMDNVVVGNDVMIAANSLVTPGKQLASGFLYAGSPARQKRPLTEKELASLTYMANNYVTLKNQYLAQENR